MANGDYKTLYEESLKKNRKLEEDLKDANHTVALLTRHLSETQKQLETVEKIVKKTLSDMTDTVHQDDR